MSAKKKRISRRKFLRDSAGIGIGASLSSQALAGMIKNEDSRPNLLFIFSDQHRAHALGCYGDKQINTPNFDEFADQGLLFRNAFSVTPVCSPFRANLMTGLYAHHNGVITNGIQLRHDLSCVGRTFEESGYATGYIGKWHLGPVAIDNGPGRLGFDYWAANYSNHNYFKWHYYSGKEERVEGEGYEPEMQTELCKDFLNRNKDKKWCLFLSWGPPHPPYFAPPGYTHYKELDQRPNLKYEKEKKFFVEVGPHYYGLVESIDTEFGKIMQALEELNLSENTIVVYTSDHGDMLGGQGFKQKRWPYEESIKIPFLIRWPAKINGGSQVDTLVSSIDFYPTISGLAGLNVPPGLDGKDLSSSILGKDLSIESEYAYLTMHYGFVPWPGWRGIRTANYLYARIKSRPWLLFDIKNDPYQLENLVTDSAKKALAEELDFYLLEVMKKVGDSWEVKTSQGDIENWIPPGKKFEYQDLGGVWPLKS
jgi:arylsulfatase A-like enzyme